MTTFKYQEEFAEELAIKWAEGKRSYVRGTIRQLKNKAQTAHVSALIAHILEPEPRLDFITFMHPNNK